VDQPRCEGAVPWSGWFLLFVLIRQGPRGRSGPQRLIRVCGEEIGNPILAFHRPSLFPSFERAPHHTTTENPLRAVVRRLNSVAGFAEPALSLIGHTPTWPSNRGPRANLLSGIGIKQADIVKQKQRTLVLATAWCLLFVLIRQVLRGGRTR